MGSIYSEVLRIWRSAWRELLLWDVVSQAVSLAALGPCLTWILRHVVARRGDSALGNLDIAWFVLNPVDGPILLAIVAGGLAIYLARMTGLVLIGQAARSGRLLSPWATLRAVAAVGPRILALSQLALLAMAAVLLPMCAIAAGGGFLLLRDHDVNYYLDARPWEYWAAVGVGLTLTTMAAACEWWLMVRIMLALPALIEGPADLVGAFGKARRTVAENRRLLLRVLLVWFGGSLGLVAVANAALHVAADRFIDALGDQTRGVLFALGALAAVSGLVNFIVNSVSSTALCLMALVLDRGGRESQGDVAVQRSNAAPVRDPNPQRRGGWLIMSGAALAAAGSVAIAIGLIDSGPELEIVDVSAHRGSSKVAPENSLAAVRQALSDGATFVEIDVQRTADGVLVVNHDADLMRVGGVPLVIHRSRLAELQAVDIGRRQGAGFAGERIPTLDEVLDQVAGKAKLIVELKSYRDDPVRLVAEVVEVFGRRKLHDAAVVMSLKYSEIRDVRRLDPRIRCGFVVSAKLGDATRLDVDFLAISKRQATDWFIATAHAAGKDVFVWTIDDPRAASQLIDRGVDNLITNDPPVILEVLRSRTELSTSERLLLRFRSLYVD